MSMRFRRACAATAAALAFAAPSGAQQPSPPQPQRAGLMGDLATDVAQVEAKLMGLAREMPASKQTWRPAAGVRSVGEVFLHVAADNYLMPSGMGVAPAAATGIKPADYATVTAFESRRLPRDSTIAALQASFAHLRKAMADTPDARLDERVKFFGQDMTVRQLWLFTTTHLHEHLGQAIAYARANGVVPPWSRKGG